MRDPCSSSYVIHPSSFFSFPVHGRVTCPFTCSAAAQAQAQRLLKSLLWPAYPLQQQLHMHSNHTAFALALPQRF